jgi:hypothetical protein
LHSDAGSPLPLAFSGSKAGATFRLAMISIAGGLKPRASQRCRNNRLMLVMENGGPGRFFWVSRDPPPCGVRGAGGAERSHGLKLNHSVMWLLHKKLSAVEFAPPTPCSGPGTRRKRRPSPGGLSPLMKLPHHGRQREPPRLRPISDRRWESDDTRRGPLATSRRSSLESCAAGDRAHQRSDEPERERVTMRWLEN